MALDLAPNAAGFFIFSSLELLFILIPLIFFKVQDKDLKQEFLGRIFPSKRGFKKRILDVIIGVGLGFGFYYLSKYLSQTIYTIIVEFKGEQYYQDAAAGSVNTTPPSFSTIEFVFSIIVMFIFVGLSEEYCFRGVLLKEFARKNRALGVILSSVIFMLYHVFPGIVPWMTFLTFWPYYLIFGIILSLVVVLNDFDLLMAIIAHGNFNAILLIVKYI